MPKTSCIVSTAAAVGMGALAALSLKRAFQTKQDKFKIPSELLSGKYADEMKLAVRVAIEGE